MLTGIDGIYNFTAKELGAIVKDPFKSAEAANLVYVKDSDPGIKRIKKGNKFLYLLDNKKHAGKKDLERIKKIVIPPAWENVWICLYENGHLQATGTDIKNRKQYRYHLLWNSLRNHTKFFSLYEFGKTLSYMRLQIEKDLALKGLPLEKVLALVVSLMERTNIRIGNELYEKLYGSYGLTTLKDKHVKVSGNTMCFTFKGKKGINHTIKITSKRLAMLVKKCRDIPGKELFQYLDENQNHRSIDSGMVNEYIKKISGKNFSAKDFRTWAGTIHAFMAFKTLGFSDTATEVKKNIIQALLMVSKQLGNTPTVCKKYYVHPIVISMYEDKSLENYIKKLDKIEVDDNQSGLAPEEKILMTLLEKEFIKV